MFIISSNALLSFNSLLLSKTIFFFSAKIKEKGHAVLNKLNRRVEHSSGLRANSSRYESEDILVSKIQNNYTSIFNLFLKCIKNKIIFVSKIFVE